MYFINSRLLYFILKKLFSIIIITLDIFSIVHGVKQFPRGDVAVLFYFNK